MKNRPCSSVKLLLILLTTILLTHGIALSAERPEKILISGGTAGGAWGAVTEGIAEVLRQSLSGTAVSTTPGTDATNFMRLEKSACDLAIGVSSTGLRAIDGKDPFKEKSNNIRGISALFEEPFQFVILDKTGIKDFSDLKSRNYPLRHSPNKKGNFMEILCEEVFRQYGFDNKVLESWGGKIFYNSYSESINLLRSGSLDSLSGCSPIPTTQFQELSGTHEVSILPLNEAVIGLLNREFGTKKIVIHAGTYKFLKSDVPTVAARNILACKADLPDDLVYEMTKSLHEKNAFLSGIHVVLKGMNPGFMADLGGIPLHPGAEKFYMEIGALK